MKSTNLQEIEIRVNPFLFSANACGDPRDPLVIFLHGFPQFSDAWEPILPTIASRGFYCVAFDQRGYSSEARPRGARRYRVEALTKDVLGVVKTLGHHVFHVVGHDWGGYVAWALAAEHPDKVLTNTVLSTPHPRALEVTLKTNLDQLRRSRYIALFLAPFHIAENYLRARNWQALRRIYKNHVGATAVFQNVKRLSEDGALTAVLNWYRSPSSPVAIGQVSVSTFYLWGSEDQALGEKAARLTRQYVSGTYRFEILLGASHWLIEDRPSEVSALIIEHLISIARN